MKKISTCILFVFISTYTFAQTNEQIKSAIENGNVKELSSFFDTHVDLTVLSKEGIYSTSQTQVILKNFFSTHSPGTFQIQHEGGNTQAKYVIGTYTTQNKAFRIYYLTKTTTNTTFIQKFRIEHD
ncbi:MAG: DUF4783 domain-containing protein [Bacteroidales bacterium]